MSKAEAMTQERRETYNSVNVVQNQTRHVCCLTSVHIYVIRVLRLGVPDDNRELRGTSTPTVYVSISKTGQSFLGLVQEVESLTEIDGGRNGG